MEKILIPLGEVLLKRGVISPQQLDDALALQKRRGGRLGDIVIGQGIVSYYKLYQAIAEHYRLPFVDLLKDTPDLTLMIQPAAESYLKMRAIPWKRKGKTIIVAVSEISDETLEWIEAQFGADTELAITSPFDIRRTIEAHFGESLEKKSRLALWQQNPQASARYTVDERQKYLITLLLVAAIAVTAFWPNPSAQAFTAMCYVAFAAAMIFKCTIFLRGLRPARNPEWDNCLKALDERNLPVYTVLVPMYREAKSLPGLLAAMEALDYPSDKLDIKLVMEADDRETLEAAEKLKPSYRFEIIRVPSSPLRTKPKACNYALRFAHGEYITIFDADDRPEPLQLKKAVYSFMSLPPDVGCLQARLQYYNQQDNWLTRSFSLEYSMLFSHMLMGLQRMGIPIPLGGTSNHISLEKLRDLGEWDPFNVTEDAELGIRLSAHGLRTVMLDSYTEEEAPNEIGAWVNQRSRWIKGYMQTWLVHMRNASQLYRRLGGYGFTGFHFFVGLPNVVFLTAPLVWLLTGVWFLDLFGNHVRFPEWVGWMVSINLILNIATHWATAFYCAQTYNKGRISMYFAAFAYPVYTLLHSIASYKALYQLIVKPHFWEKTAHGEGKYATALAASKITR